MAEARYDAIAEFYQATFSRGDDPDVARLLDLLGPPADLHVLDLACGHGRLSRELARRGAVVLGVDLSRALLHAAEAAERAEPLGIRYTHGDAAAPSWLDSDRFDAVTCCFGLSDIDDFDGAAATIARALHPGGRFVFSILHPCFPGSPEVSSAWPTGGRYHDERYWRADGSLSTLRRQVGAHHRTLSTYLNTLRRHGLHLDEMTEPAPPGGRNGQREDADRFPTTLIARLVKDADTD
jgi:2-polyprenyl-3-methyl-5-hydroxy-6-metoxy-1,4-benzoquinol methylase